MGFLTPDLDSFAEPLKRLVSISPVRLSSGSWDLLINEYIFSAPPVPRVRPLIPWFTKSGAGPEGGYRLDRRAVPKKPQACDIKGWVIADPSKCVEMKTWTNLIYPLSALRRCDGRLCCPGRLTFCWKPSSRTRASPLATKRSVMGPGKPATSFHVRGGLC